MDKGCKDEVLSLKFQMIILANFSISSKMPRTTERSMWGLDFLFIFFLKKSLLVHSNSVECLTSIAYRLESIVYLRRHSRFYKFDVLINSRFQDISSLSELL